MGMHRTYSDADLAAAVRMSSSWRGVLRVLGLRATSSAAIRSIRSHADRLQLDSSHFTRGRTWTDGQLAAAVREENSWAAVADRLAILGGSAVPSIQRHAMRLELDTSHFETKLVSQRELAPDMANLAATGSMIAASWYSLCGLRVSWPLEPGRFDLLVSDVTGTRRVQVKTTTSKTDSGAWQVHVAGNGRYDTRVYSPDEIDDFFLIDGDLNFYIVPIEAMRALHTIRLSAYTKYRVRVGHGLGELGAFAS